MHDRALGASIASDSGPATTGTIRECVGARSTSLLMNASASRSNPYAGGTVPLPRPAPLPDPGPIAVQRTTTLNVRHHSPSRIQPWRLPSAPDTWPELYGMGASANEVVAADYGFATSSDGRVWQTQRLR